MSSHSSSANTTPERVSYSQAARSGRSEQEKEQEKEGQRRRESLASNEIRLGDRLADDWLNSFMDHLQTKSPVRYDGMLAIQFLLREPEECAALISGKHAALQIVYDPSREHYFVTKYDIVEKAVIFYDSMVPRKGHHRGIVDTYDKPVLKQIQGLFGHLFPDRQVHIILETDMDYQRDDWSCGYRAVGTLLSIMRSVDPSSFKWHMENLLAILQYHLDGHAKQKEWEWWTQLALGEEYLPHPNTWVHVCLSSSLTLTPWTGDVTKARKGVLRAASELFDPAPPTPLSKSRRGSEKDEQTTEQKEDVNNNNNKPEERTHAIKELAAQTEQKQAAWRAEQLRAQSGGEPREQEQPTQEEKREQSARNGSFYREQQSAGHQSFGLPREQTAQNGCLRYREQRTQDPSEQWSERNDSFTCESMLKESEQRTQSYRTERHPRDAEQRREQTTQNESYRMPREREQTTQSDSQCPRRRGDREQRTRDTSEQWREQRTQNDSHYSKRYRDMEQRTQVPSERGAEQRTQNESLFSKKRGDREQRTLDPSELWREQRTQNDSYPRRHRDNHYQEQSIRNGTCPTRQREQRTQDASEQWREQATQNDSHKRHREQRTQDGSCRHERMREREQVTQQESHKRHREREQPTQEPSHTSHREKRHRVEQRTQNDDSHSGKRREPTRVKKLESYGEAMQRLHLSKEEEREKRERSVFWTEDAQLREKTLRKRESEKRESEKRESEKREWEVQENSRPTNATPTKQTTDSSASRSGSSLSIHTVHSYSLTSTTSTGSNYHSTRSSTGSYTYFSGDEDDSKLSNGSRHPAGRSSSLHSQSADTCSEEIAREKSEEEERDQRRLAHIAKHLEENKPYYFRYVPPAQISDKDVTLQESTRARSDAIRGAQEEAHAATRRGGGMFQRLVSIIHQYCRRG